MAPVERLVPTSHLKTSFLSKLASGKKAPLFFNYDEEADILMLLLAPPDTETVVHYVDDDVAVLYTPDKMEIVGLQIEDFQSEFMPSYNSLQKIWKLSCSGIKDTENLWDLTVAVEEEKVNIAIETVKAARPLIGASADKLEMALQYA